IAKTASVKVSDFPFLESFPQVHHLLAEVQATKKDSLELWQVLMSLFPGASITGAPKIKAMEWIQRLEGFARGIFTGSLGYFSFSGQSQWNIAIRTGLLKGAQLDLFAGGGITVDSDPQAEYEETWSKLEGWKKTLLGK
ncbi:MAG: chorismate-binding protein, partial [Deltaproteobacteria bacterium]|nr:chorismate-binding protein [Deltaproteobacteria bacterium]